MLLHKTIHKLDKQKVTVPHDDIVASSPKDSVKSLGYGNLINSYNAITIVNAENRLVMMSHYSFQMFPGS